jgi:hypothetical protein
MTPDTKHGASFGAASTTQELADALRHINRAITSPRENGTLLAASDRLLTLERDNAALREALKSPRLIEINPDFPGDCGRCGEPWGAHIGPDCPDEGGRFSVAVPPHARGGAPDLHLHDGPLICKVCATPVSGEGVTEDAGATWMHLRCFKPQPGGTANG